MVDIPFLQKKEGQTSKGKSFSKKKAKTGGAQSSNVNHILHLQQTIGNQAVQRMIRNGTLQLKSNLIQEEEAWSGEVNRLAQSVEPAQRQPVDEEEETQLTQGKFAAQRDDVPEEEETVEGKFEKSMQRKVDNTGIPEEVRANMENAFQADFSDVKVHPDSSKAPAVGALAYTQGTDIHFAPGQYKPDTSSGRQLLAHELTHVQQQREGKVKPTTEVKGLPVNDDPSFEKEADKMGKKVS